MTLTQERRDRIRARQFEASIAREEARLTGLRLKRKAAADHGQTATVDAFDVEIGNLERFIERQKQRANEPREETS